LGLLFAVLSNALFVAAGFGMAKLHFYEEEYFTCAAGSI
jgi:hypothetical protein